MNIEHIINDEKNNIILSRKSWNCCKFIRYDENFDFPITKEDLYASDWYVVDKQTLVKNIHTTEGSYDEFRKFIEPYERGIPQTKKLSIHSRYLQSSHSFEVFKIDPEVREVILKFDSFCEADNYYLREKKKPMLKKDTILKLLKIWDNFSGKFASVKTKEGLIYDLHRGSLTALYEDGTKVNLDYF